MWRENRINEEKRKEKKDWRQDRGPKEYADVERKWNEREKGEEKGKEGKERRMKRREQSKGGLKCEEKI